MTEDRAAGIPQRPAHPGEESLPQFKTKNGWVLFELPPGTPQITGETLDEWEKAEHEEEPRRAFSPRR
jgi:hypothetical protein